MDFNAANLEIIGETGAPGNLRTECRKFEIMCDKRLDEQVYSNKRKEFMFLTTVAMYDDLNILQASNLLV